MQHDMHIFLFLSILPYCLEVTRTVRLVGERSRTERAPSQILGTEALYSVFGKLKRSGPIFRLVAEWTGTERLHPVLGWGVRGRTKLCTETGEQGRSEFGTERLRPSNFLEQAHSASDGNIPIGSRSAPQVWQPNICKSRMERLHSTSLPNQTHLMYTYVL
jgi:hypothetical protein